MANTTHTNRGRRIGTSRAAYSVLMLLLVSGIGLALLTSSAGGIGWDGPYEVELGALLMQTGSDQASLETLRQAWAPQDLSKGPLLFWVAQALGTLTPLPAWSGNILDPHNYELMGIGSVIIGLVGTAILAGCLSYSIASRTVGLLTLGLTWSLPLWIGLSALDYRDTQVASGLAAVTGAGLLLNRATTNARVTLAIGVFAAAGGFLAVGSRSGSVLLLGALVIWLVVTTAVLRRHAISAMVVPSLVLIVGAVVGTALAVLSHPLGRVNPVQWLTDAVLLASDHPNVMLVRVLGQNVTSDESPWWYVPAWLAAQLPIATSAAIILTIIGFAVLKPRTPLHSPISAAGITLMGPAVVIPVMVLLTGPNLFDGIRHLLFLIPPLFALISTLFWSLLDRRLPFSKSNKHLAVAALTWSMVAVVGLSIFASARWFPYSYAFVNPIAGAIKEPRIWEYDYWGVSAREAISELRNQGVERVFIRPSAQSSAVFGGEEFTAYLENPSRNWGGITFLRWDAELPQECAVTVTISRDGIPLAQAGKCAGG